MSQRDESEHTRCVASCLSALIQEAGGVSALIVPRGYSHLGLAVIDAVFSLRARYEGTVLPVLQRYSVGVPGLEDCRSWADDGVQEHSAAAVAARLRDLTPEEGAELFGNWQCSPGTSTRKAVTVLRVASTLTACGASSHQDLRARWEDPALARAVLRVPGAGDATWRYICSLSRIERVNPDTFVAAWVRTCAGASWLPARRCAQLLEDACGVLADDGTAITVRTADHLVWRKQSGRPLS